MNLYKEHAGIYFVEDLKTIRIGYMWMAQKLSTKLISHKAPCIRFSHETKTKSDFDMLKFMDTAFLRNIVNAHTIVEKNITRDAVWCTIRDGCFLIFVFYHFSIDLFNT